MAECINNIRYDYLIEIVGRYNQILFDDYQLTARDKSRCLKKNNKKAIQRTIYKQNIFLIAVAANKVQRFLHCEVKMLKYSPVSSLQQREEKTPF